MACEQELADLQQATSALDTSILAAEYANAVVSSNALNVMNRTMIYQTCMMGGMMVETPEDQPPQRMTQEMAHAIAIQTATEMIERWQSILKHESLCLNTLINEKQSE